MKVDARIYSRGDTRIVETDADSLAVIRGALRRFARECPQYAEPVGALADVLTEDDTG